MKTIASINTCSNGTTKPIPFKLYGNPDRRRRHPEPHRLPREQVGHAVFARRSTTSSSSKDSRPPQSSSTHFRELPKSPRKAMEDLRAHFSSQKQVVTLGRQVSNAEATLLQKARNFILQVSDFVASPDSR